MKTTTRLFFITDIHGSDVCYRKLLNSVKTRKSPDILVIGGDILGKIIVPLVARADGGREAWLPRTDAGFRKVSLSSHAEIDEFDRRLANHGEYGFRCDPDEARAFLADETFRASVVERLQCERLCRWVEMADERLHGTGRVLYCNAGNDDRFYADPILDQGVALVRPEGKVIQLDPWLTMISTGYANITPWNCPRDVPEEEMERRIEEMARLVPDPRRCIFNIHPPPHGTTLDRAKQLKNFVPQMSALGAEVVSVGSTAVRRAVEKYQPRIGLHGHIHEVHAHDQIGPTLCFNPGSEYNEGRLRGVFLEFERGELKSYGLTREAG